MVKSQKPWTTFNETRTMYQKKNNKSVAVINKLKKIHGIDSRFHKILKKKNIQLIINLS